MKKILVITTRDLPEIPIHNEGLYHLISSEKLDAYIKENKGEMPQNIGEYLQHYDEETGKVKEIVAKNLAEYVDQNENECTIPILRRDVNDSFLIFVTLCLSNEFSGYGDAICHGYINAILDDINANLKCSTSEDKPEFYLMAHSMDIVKENNGRGLSRYVSMDELKNDFLKNQIKQINIFCHDDDDEYYKHIISHLSDEKINADFLKAMNV